jgi:hypothetical protein
LLLKNCLFNLKNIYRIGFTLHYEHVSRYNYSVSLSTYGWLEKYQLSFPSIQHPPKISIWVRIGNHHDIAMVFKVYFNFWSYPGVIYNCISLSPKLFQELQKLNQKNKTPIQLNYKFPYNTELTGQGPRASWVNWYLLLITPCIPITLFILPLFYSL